MDIYINNEQKIIDPSGLDSLVEKVIQAGLQVCQMSDDVEVSITFVDNQTIQALNNEYRQIDAVTDVLSFPQVEAGDFGLVPGMPRLLGDIVISLEKALEQCQDYNHSFQREVGFLVAHGLLHLLGYDHETAEERKAMRVKEEQIMEEVNLPRA